jgi:hypothetical protein
MLHEVGKHVFSIVINIRKAGAGGELIGSQSPNILLTLMARIPFPGYYFAELSIASWDATHSIFALLEISRRAFR